MHAYLRTPDWKRTVALTGATVHNPAKAIDGWTEVDLDQHAYALGNEQVSEPFFCPDGTWRVIHDYDPEQGFINAAPLSFGGLRASAAAWRIAAQRLKDDEDIDQLTLECNQLLAQGKVLELSKRICVWGGKTGPRVWGNLKRFHAAESDERCSELETKLLRWLTEAATQNDPGVAIQPGVDIQGLDVSYASKHLRILFPDDHATLDSIICQRMGYALNPAGYRLFIDSLKAFKASSAGLPPRLGDMESGLFYLLIRGRRSVV